MSAHRGAPEADSPKVLDMLQRDLQRVRQRALEAEELLRAIELSVALAQRLEALAAELAAVTAERDRLQRMQGLPRRIRETIGHGAADSAPH